MTRRVAIATCREFPSLYEDDRPIIERLAAANVVAEPCVWNDEIDWSRFHAVLIRSSWDYFEHEAAFRRWLATLDRSRIPCWNPVSLVRWNLDKHYLRDLEAKGVATVPTVWIDRAQGRSAEAAVASVRETGWSELVVKPAISGGAWRTLRLRREELVADAPAIRELLEGGDVLAQPFLREIVEHGELSLLFFDARYSHAVVKRPRAGDFRVQWSHGGTHAATTPDESIIEQARAVLAAAPSPGLYARVDGVVKDGRLILMELEQIEPYLFLAESPGAVDRFVAALLRRM